MTNSDQSNLGDCPFCRIDASNIVAANRLAIAIRDFNPVTPLHTLILPRRHVASYFDLTREEAMAVNELSKSLRDGVLATDSEVEGFNVGVNIGAVAGQTISSLPPSPDPAPPRGCSRPVGRRPGDYPPQGPLPGGRADYRLIE